MFTNVHQCFFLLNVVYFSVCLTSNKLYWIEDQLADISTRFYTSTSWRRRIGPSASWLLFDHLTAGAWAACVSSGWRREICVWWTLSQYLSRELQMSRKQGSSFSSWAACASSGWRREICIWWTLSQYLSCELQMSHKQGSSFSSPGHRSAHFYFLCCF